MTRDQAIEHLREYVSRLVSIHAYLGSEKHIALSLIIGEGILDGKPNPKFYRKVISPGRDSWKRMIMAIRPDITDDEKLEMPVFNMISRCLMIRISRGIL